MTQEFDTDYTKEIICPYCGHEHEDSHEIATIDEDGEHECEECCKNFGWSARYEVYYSTDKIPCANNETEHDYRLYHEYENGNKFYKCRNCSSDKMEKKS